MQNTSVPVSADPRVEEIMDVLVAISVVSKRLARKIAAMKYPVKEGAKQSNEHNE